MDRRNISSGSPYERTVGFSRAVRIGGRVLVSGTAPIWSDGSCDPDPGVQAGRCLEIILAALAEFERERIRERVRAGLQRARVQGKRLGRPRRRPVTVNVPGGTVRAAAKAWGVSKSTAARWVNCGRVARH